MAESSFIRTAMDRVPIAFAEEVVAIIPRESRPWHGWRTFPNLLRLPSRTWTAPARRNWVTRKHLWMWDISVYATECQGECVFNIRRYDERRGDHRDFISIEEIGKYPLVKSCYVMFYEQRPQSVNVSSPISIAELFRKVILPFGGENVDINGNPEVFSAIFQQIELHQLALSVIHFNLSASEETKIDFKELLAEFFRRQLEFGLVKRIFLGGICDYLTEDMLLALMQHERLQEYYSYDNPSLTLTIRETKALIANWEANPRFLNTNSCVQDEFRNFDFTKLGFARKRSADSSCSRALRALNLQKFFRSLNSGIFVRKHRKVDYELRIVTRKDRVAIRCEYDGCRSSD